MKIYQKSKRFDEKTGKPKYIWIFKEIRCDYTGEILDGDVQYCNYVLSYEDRDSCFGADGEEFDFGERYKIDMHEFLSVEYHFFACPDEYAEAWMFQEASKNWNKKKNEWYRCYTFDAMCRHARIRTAERLIKEKTITLDQLYWNHI
jgi:hypothetical protein